MFLTRLQGETIHGGSAFSCPSTNTSPAFLSSLIHFLPQYLTMMSHKSWHYQSHPFHHSLSPPSSLSFSFPTSGSWPHYRHGNVWKKHRLPCSFSQNGYQLKKRAFCDCRARHCSGQREWVVLKKEHVVILIWCCELELWPHKKTLAV